MKLSEGGSSKIQKGAERLSSPIRASPVAHMVNNLPAMQETWVWSLDQEEPLDKGIATHFSILTWRILWTEEPGGLQSMESQKLDTTERLTLHTSPIIGFPVSFIAVLWLGEGWGRKRQGTSLEVQWLRLCFQCWGCRLDPWLGNKDPACHVVWPPKTKQKQKPKNFKKEEGRVAKKGYNDLVQLMFPSCFSSLS